MLPLLLLVFACGPSGPPSAPAPAAGEDPPAASTEEEAVIRAFQDRDGWTTTECGSHGGSDDFRGTWCLAARGDLQGNFSIEHTHYGFASEIASRPVGDAKYTVQVYDLAAGDEVLQALVEAGVSEGPALDDALTRLGWTVGPEPGALSDHGHARKGDQRVFARRLSMAAGAPGSRRRDKHGSTAVLDQGELLVSVSDPAKAREILDRWVPAPVP